MTASVVTIDGPSGTGKSTVSRLVATRLGYPHLDTGAFYRAATLLALESGIDPGDGPGIVAALERAELAQDAGRMILNRFDVSDDIRSERVTASVSMVSAHPGVRARLVQLQREWVDDHDGCAVVEGRDIGSVVFPEAAHKVYLDASPQVRASRRAHQDGVDASEVLESIRRRDHIDSTRAVSPLSVAEGAVVVDTSKLSVSEVVEKIVAIVTN